jgi:hypothetical protein
MSYAVTPDDPGYVDVLQLRVESGWYEVANGLTRMLLGNLIIMGSWFVGVGLFVLAFFGIPGKNDKLINDVYFEVTCYGAVALILLGSSWGYGMIVLGQWKCLKNASERHGCRWLIFSSMTCVLMGPTLNIGCSWGGVKNQPNFQRGARNFKMVEFSQSTRYLQMASSGITMTSVLLFVLFLRAVARCFGDTARVFRVNLYLVFMGLLLGGSIYVGYNRPDLLFRNEIALGILGGWVLSGLWFLYLLLTVRLCIADGMHYLKSPLDPR